MRRETSARTSKRRNTSYELPAMPAPCSAKPASLGSHQLNHILLTIDVEDWFQVENFKQCIPFSSWSSYELRVEKNTHHLLDLLDSIKLQPSGYGDFDSESKIQNPESSIQHLVPPQARLPRVAKHCGQGGPRSCQAERGGQGTTGQVKRSSSMPCEMQSLFHRGEAVLHPPAKLRATFFVLGWIAERLPQLVREIHSRGHEVASHGYYHNLCDQISTEDLKIDLFDSKKLLEDTIGSPVYGYRAPSFCINNDILKIIDDCGYHYDSSYNSFAIHGRYGHLDLSRNGTRGIAYQISKTQHQEPLPREIHDSDSEAYFTGAKSKIFYELPISNIKIGKRVFPWGGGGYFRLIPFPIFKIGVQSILNEENAYLLYLHPWEIDPEQPRVKEVSASFKFRHYINLSRTQSKLNTFFRTFSQCRFLTCYHYLEEIIA